MPGCIHDTLDIVRISDVDTLLARVRFAFTRSFKFNNSTKKLPDSTSDDCLVAPSCCVNKSSMISKVAFNCDNLELVNTHLSLHVEIT